MPPLFRLRQSCVLPLALSLAGVAPAQGQAPSNETPRWVGHFAVLAGNATVGALTGAILQTLKGGSFKDGFARGALGGAVAYAGKEVVVRDFWGAGLLGREIHAVGVSIVRNASDARPSLSRLFLPVGPLPLRANLDLVHGLRIHPQLDLSAAGWLLYGLYETRLYPDWGQSLSSGAAVFQADRRRIIDEGRDLAGFAASRSIFLSDPIAATGVGDWGAVLAHERVHVLQQDLVLCAWSQPLAEFALQRLPAGRAISRYVAVDALDWVLGAVTGIMSPADRDRFPTELEAHFLVAR
jgi:hypothetical protein